MNHPHRIHRSRTLAAGMMMGVVLSCVGPKAIDQQSNGGGSGGMGTSPGVDLTFQGDPTCASGNTLPHVDDPDDLEDLGYEEDDMNAGEPCVACHAKEDGPEWRLGGTVFATGKVTDRCEPPSGVTLSDAVVVVTDVNGIQHFLAVTALGNFYADEEAMTPSLEIPPGEYRAEVRYNGKTRAMVAPQTDGDCNKCHTAAGANGAPGRIALPQ